MTEEDNITTKQHPFLNLTVTSDGRVYQDNKILIPYPVKNSIYIKYKAPNPRYPKTSDIPIISKTRSVKMIVWETFRGIKLGEWLHIDHQDNNPVNCSVDNLALSNSRPSNKWLSNDCKTQILLDYAPYLPQETKKEFKPTIIIRKKKTNEHYSH